MSWFIDNIVAPKGQQERGRRLRRAFPITMYIGRNGAGKSIALIEDTIPDLLAGKHVLSTVRLLDFERPRPCDDPRCGDTEAGFKAHEAGHMAAHPLYVPFTDWRQFMEWTHGPILMDEITGVADSNEGAAMPSAVANKMAQLRRDDVTIRATGLSFIRANKRFREAVSSVVRCQSYFPKDFESTDGSNRAWKQRRLAIWKTYDAQSLPVDDHTESAYEKADLLNTTRLWIPSAQSISAYDTYDAVLRVGHVSDAGRCVTCDGTRRVHQCSCPDYTAKHNRKRDEERTDGVRAPQALRRSSLVADRPFENIDSTSCTFS
jgi:hypothetical protein